MYPVIVSEKVDVNTKNDLGETAIFSAIIHKNMDAVDVLIDYGCDINSEWQLSTPIYLMLCNKDVDSCMKVMNKGALITTLPGLLCVYGSVVNRYHVRSYKEGIASIIMSLK